MGYYSDVFKEIARDPRGEAMVPRVSIRLRNGTNGLYRSSDLDDVLWVKSSGNITVAASDPAGEPPPYGVSHIMVTSGSPAAYEKVSQTRTAERNDRYVFWGLFHEYVGTGSTDTHLQVWDSAIGGSTNQYATFSWSSGVPSLLASSGVTDAGVLAVSDGWYVLWFSADFEGNGGAKGDDFPFAVYPSAGDSTAGRGVYCAHLQAELGMGSTGPRRPDAQGDGPWAVVDTVDTIYERGGVPGELFTVESRDETTLSINPIITKRERRFGVVESQSWQAKITNLTRGLSDEDLAGAWACIEAGFQSEGQWAVVGQGQIERPRASGDLTVQIDVVAAMKEMIQRELPRWLFVDNDTAHASQIESVSRAEGSSYYDNDASGAGVTIDASGFIAESIYTIEFLSATTYQVTRESDGTVYDNSGSGWAIGSDQQIDGISHTIQSEGWTGTYATGDQFAYTLSERRNGTNAITPVPLLIELLTSEDFLGLKVFNVKGGYFYDSPLYDKANTWDAAVANYTTTEFKGEWEAEDKIIDMVQGILKVIHGSIYAMPNGQLALWETQPNEVDSVFLNGRMDARAQHILDATSESDFREVYNVIRYKYHHLADGSAAELSERDTDSTLERDRVHTVDIGKWRCDNGSVDAAASKALTRLKAARPFYTLMTTPAGAVIDMSEPASFDDVVLGITKTGLVSEITLDVKGNQASIVLLTDPVILNNYAVVGDAYTDPVGSVVGGTDLVF